LGDVVVLPAVMFGGPQGQTLDGMWPQEVEEALGRRVEVISTDGSTESTDGAE
jgi:hypothetical protein